MPGMSLFSSSSDANREAQISSGLFAPLHKRLLLLVADLVFPPRCAGCGRVDQYWCAVCQDDINQMPLTPYVNPLPPLAAIASTGTHTGKLREAVQGLKYDNNRQLAEPLGKRLAARLATMNWTIDMLVPVPLHAMRLAERGYNQAQVVAEYLTAHVGIPCVPQAIYREKFTRSQVELSAAERLANLADAFQGEYVLLSGRTILLIDDVYTTGATLSNCAQAALAAGARAVYGLTVTAARSY
jgi:ComF family protein